MKTILLCFLFIGATTMLHAQILAGVIGDLEYTETNIDLQILTNPLNNFQELTDTLDVDGDGTGDLAFQVTLANIPDFVGSVITASSLNPNVETMITDFGITRLELNDPVSPDSIFESDLGWPMAANFWGIAGLMQYGQWLNDYSGYMGFRVGMPDDTLYGWLDVYAEANQEYVKLKVYGYAQGPLINGVEEQKTATFGLFPNPASTHVVVDVPVGEGILAIYNTFGQCVLERSFDNLGGGPLELDVSSLLSGHYYISVFTSEGGGVSFFNKVLIINR